MSSEREISTIFLKFLRTFDSPQRDGSRIKVDSIESLAGETGECKMAETKLDRAYQVYTRALTTTGDRAEALRQNRVIYESLFEKYLSSEGQGREEILRELERLSVLGRKLAR